MGEHKLLYLLTYLSGPSPLGAVPRTRGSMTSAGKLSDERAASNALHAMSLVLPQPTRQASADNVAAAAASNDVWTTERRSYRDLRNRKREEFWQTKIESERSTPQRLWRSIHSLMGRGHAPPSSSSIDAQDLHRFFEEKIDGVRASTANAAPPSIVSAPSDCQFPVFCALDVDDVIGTHRRHP